MSAITFPGGPTAAVESTFNSWALFPPNTGFRVESAHTLVRIVIGGAVVQSQPFVVANDAARTRAHVAGVAAKYRAIRESVPKRERSGDSAIRLSEFEANRVSIREAENLRK